MSTTRDCVVSPALIIFDGNCGICRALQRWAEGHDAAGRLAFLPYQSPDLARLAPGLTSQMASRALYFVRGDGRRFRGARAAFETLRRLPGAWGVVGAILACPLLSLLAEPFYRLIAHYRHYISRRLGLAECDLWGHARPVTSRVGDHLLGDEQNSLENG